MAWQRAMVTGASSGIGEAIARQLAKQGVDLVLVARRGERLQALADRLLVDVEILVADLADDDQRAVAEARLVADEDPIDLLVANAGVAWIGSILDGQVDDADTMIRLNVLSLARMVHLALPGMAEAGHGGILLTSSTASFQPTPFSANYGATKAFVTSLAEAVHAEMDGTGVHVTALCPGPTRTEIEQANGMATSAPDFLYADADDVARAGLAGLAENRALVIPGAGNKMGAALPRLVPRSVDAEPGEAALRPFRRGPNLTRQDMGAITYRGGGVSPPYSAGWSDARSRCSARSSRASVIPPVIIPTPIPPSTSTGRCAPTYSRDAAVVAAPAASAREASGDETRLATIATVSDTAVCPDG